jgi:hypothetical protein
VLTIFLSVPMDDDEAMCLSLNRKSLHSRLFEYKGDAAHDSTQKKETAFVFLHTFHHLGPKMDISRCSVTYRISNQYDLLAE